MMNVRNHPNGSVNLCDLARDIAIESGVVKACDEHPHFYQKTGIALEAAYKLAEELIAIEQIEGVEHSQLHYAIEQFLHEQVDESCPECGSRCGVSE